MTTDDSVVGFPDILVPVLAEHLGRLEWVSGTVARHLNPADPSKTVGICPEEFVPDEYEMTGRMTQEPTVSTYAYTIEYIVKADASEMGERLARQAARAIRLMLYRDDQLSVALRQLTDRGEDRVERIIILPRIGSQQYADNRIEGSFVFMNATHFTIQTETV